MENGSIYGAAIKNYKYAIKKINAYFVYKWIIFEYFILVRYRGLIISTMKTSLPPPPPSISPLYKKIAKAII